MDTTTYAVGITEPLHPDPQVAGRMVEAAISSCAHGCKVYADPRSNVRVVAHNAAYGCTERTGQ